MEIIDSLFLLGSIQGYLLLFALIFKNSGKKQVNYFFYLLLFVICLILTAKLVITEELFRTSPHIWYFIDLLAYTLGPLWYFTILRSFKSKLIFSKLDFICFLPASYQVISKVYLLSLSSEELLLSQEQGWYIILFYAFCLTVFLVNASFLFRSYLILRNNKSVKFPDLLIKGQYAMLIVLSVWVLSLLINLIFSNDYEINLNLYRIAFLTMSFLTFALGFLALIRPESFYFLTHTYDSSKDFVMQEIAKRVLKEIADNDLFLNPNLTLGELSKSVQSSPILTSKAINNSLRTNFRDMINEFRVHYFIKLARSEQKENLTHWALAQESGFGNKVSFYKAFKKITGSTPKLYLDKN